MDIFLFHLNVSILNPSWKCQDDVICIIHSEVKKLKEDKNLEEHKFSREMGDVFNDYHQYMTATLDEKHGKMAKFWMQYVEMYIFIVTSQEVYML